MATLTIRTEEGVTLERELAGAGSRAAAMVLDLCLLGLGYGTLAIALQLVAWADPTSGVELLVGMMAGIGISLPVLWQALFALFRSRTPGKRVLGLEVVDGSGAPASLRAQLIRAVFLPVELLPLPLPIGLMTIFVEPKSRRLGDLVAGTMVLRRDERPRETLGGRRRVPRRGVGARLARGGPPSSTSDEVLVEQLTPARLARLDTADAAFLSELLGRAGLRPMVGEDLYLRTATYFAERMGLADPGAGGDPGAARRAHEFLRRLQAALA